jgi:hypothetical protein
VRAPFLIFGGASPPSEIQSRREMWRCREGDTEM